MSETFKEDPPRVLTNSEARKDTMKRACREIDEFTAQIKELQDKRNKVKKAASKDLGMTITDFNFAKKLADMDQEKRDPALDAIREMFAAREIGFQTDFIDALNKQAA